MNSAIDSITCFGIMVPSRPYNTTRLYCMSGFRTKKLVILEITIICIYLHKIRRNYYLWISLLYMQNFKELTLLFSAIIFSNFVYIGSISNPVMAIPPQFIDDQFVFGPILDFQKMKVVLLIGLWMEIGD